MDLAERHQTQKNVGSYTQICTVTDMIFYQSLNIF